MRPSRTLLATVRRSSQFLTPYTPTGLTGLYTHPAPRPHLIWLYSQTLEKLKSLPESSVYRQSTESITKHRLRIIEEAKPKGFDDWQLRIKNHINETPEAYKSGSIAKHFEVNGVTYVLTGDSQEVDEREQEWDGEPVIDYGEGPRGEDEVSAAWNNANEKTAIESDVQGIKIENEPPLTAYQIEDIEKEMGAGLLEEIVAVAEGELQLADTLLDAKVWEELEETPAEGQWQYFERSSLVGATQTA